MSVGQLEFGNGKNILKGKGEIYIARFVSGVEQPALCIGNATKFTIKDTPETIKMYSSMDPAGGLLKEAPVRHTLEGSIEGTEFSMENLVIALSGDQSVLSQGAGTVTAEDLTASVKGAWYKLAKSNVSSVVVTPAAGGTAFTVTTDYIVDAEIGRIRINTGGGITLNDSLHVAYTYAADVRKIFNAATLGINEAHIMFRSTTGVGPKHWIDIWPANITQDAELGFISDEFGSFTLKAAIYNDGATVGHSTCPYIRILENEAGA